MLTDVVLPASQDMWNWPAVSVLTRPTIARILHLHELYSTILDVPGVICEFGVHLGASTATLANLRDLLEPLNVSRHVHAFDTFSGFREPTPDKDPSLANGDFAVPKGHASKIAELVRLQRSAGGLLGDPRVHLWEGNAPESYRRFLDENQHALIAMAIFDMDVFGPTRELLAMIQPRLTAGSVLVFDQLNCPTYPGETLAALEVLDMPGSRVTKSSFLPYSTWLRWGGARAGAA